MGRLAPLLYSVIDCSCERKSAGRQGARERRFMLDSGVQHADDRTLRAPLRSGYYNAKKRRRNPGGLVGALLFILAREL